jgi:hypothetical protein
MPSLVDIVEVYLDGSANWNWKAKSANGNVIAVNPPEEGGYLLREDVDKVVAELFPDAKVKVKGGQG